MPLAPSPGSSRPAFKVRLQTLIRHWPSSDSLAKSAGVSPSALRKWLKGEAEPSRERLVALAEAAGVSLSWLAQGEGPEPDLGQVRSRRGTLRAAGAPDRGLERFLLLPKVAEGVAAGARTPAAPSESEFIGFRHDWLRTGFDRGPDEVMLFFAAGDSMEPTIHSGDLLLLDATVRSLSGFGIYVMEICGERVVKRVQRHLDGSLILISDNPRYHPETVAAEQAGAVAILGRVIWRGGVP